MPQFLGTGAFVEATFENCKSEFLQRAMYVVLTVFLLQKGSSESKPVGKDARRTRKAPGLHQPGHAMAHPARRPRMSPRG